MERDLQNCCVLLHVFHFNSHAHVERDLAMFSVVDLFINFNSHAHVERDNPEINFRCTDSEFQLTRSRGA